MDPFSGEVRDGVLWGRGAGGHGERLSRVLVAVARGLGPHGRRPPRDVVLAFTADEEDSAADGAAWLAAHAGLFEGCTRLGESGAFTFHAAPGLRLYPVGAAERGTAWLKLTARGTAGHGSRPNSRDAVTALAGAVTRIGRARLARPGRSHRARGPGGDGGTRSASTPPAPSATPTGCWPGWAGAARWLPRAAQ